MKALLVLATAALSLVPTNPATSCSCVDYLQSEPVEALKGSGLVFAGKAPSVSVVTLPVVTYSEDANGVLIPSQHMERRALVTFHVIRSWKGRAAPEITVLAGAPPDPPLKPDEVLFDCQVHFNVGTEYLVFASDEYPEANPCAPTRELSKAKEHLTALDQYLASLNPTGSTSPARP